MPKPMSIEEVLKEFAKTFADEPSIDGYFGWCGHDTDLGNCKESFDKTKLAIKELIKSKLPEEKQGIKFHSGRQNSELSAYSPKDNQKIGFNSCLSRITKIIEGL